jgi:hydroxypyruvate reductase
MNDVLRRHLLDCYQAALAAVGGRACVARRLKAMRLDAPVSLIALGKPACAMAQGARDVLGDGVASAFIVTKHGHAESLPWEVVEAGHPLPDENSIRAGARLVDYVSRLPADGTVLALLSGGASALVEVPSPGVTLEQLRAVNGWLLASGLPIHEINAIRKRLSRIKGGRLAKLLAPRRVVCLAVSDVPGDDPRAIGSGLLTADERDIPPTAALPEFVRVMLACSDAPPRADDPCFAAVQYEIIATNAHARAAAADAARRAGYAVMDDGMLMTGGAAEAGRTFARELRALPPGSVLIRGGETTVTLPASPGRGGRAQHLALAAAIELAGATNLAVLAAGTDGTDGPTEDAGGLVDGRTTARGAREDCDALGALANADAGTFLEASGDLIQTGPTGTNVMDIVMGVCAVPS